MAAIGAQPTCLTLAPLLLLLLLCCASCLEPASGFQMYVSIARKQNAWWRSVVNEFGGGCTGGRCPVHAMRHY